MTHSRESFVLKESLRSKRASPGMDLRVACCLNHYMLSITLECEGAQKGAVRHHMHPSLVRPL